MPDLSLPMAYFLAEVSYYLGYGRDLTQLSGFDQNKPFIAAGPNTQMADAVIAVNTGLRRFYTPPLVPGMPAVHKWSFLSPLGRLTTASGAYQYELPDDFGGMDGQVTYEPAVAGCGPISRIGEGKIREYRQTSTLSAGKPTVCALVPKKTTGAYGQRWLIELWPTPDAAYVLTFPYNILAQALTVNAPYPYGGPQHADTILMSCLAAAELAQNDEPGTYAEMYKERLMASIEADCQNYAPDTLGYNGDYSDSRDWGPQRHQGGQTQYMGRTW